MKKLVLTLDLVFGVLAANAQYFVGGQLGLLYDDASENTMITIAPEFGYAFNDTWTVAGMIGYTHMDNFNSFYIAPYARWNFWKKDFVGLFFSVELKGEKVLPNFFFYEMTNWDRSVA